VQVLLQLNLQQTREFFAAFFSLSDFHWHGFLSARCDRLLPCGCGCKAHLVRRSCPAWPPPPQAALPKALPAA
jgi:hypothetical protein